MTHCVRIVKVDKWIYRVNPTTLACCKLETFFAPDGMFSILVTERGDNTGPSITNDHENLRLEIFKWLQMSKQVVHRFYEQYDRDSYVPPRDDLSEICLVTVKGAAHHWQFVPDEEWEKIYNEPRKPRQEIKIRKAVQS